MRLHLLKTGKGASNTPPLFPLAKVLRRELKEKEYSVLNAVDQARVFLADQPIEAPEEPRRNPQSKTGECGSFLCHRKLAF